MEHAENINKLLGLNFREFAGYVIILILFVFWCSSQVFLQSLTLWVIVLLMLTMWGGLLYWSIFLVHSARKTSFHYHSWMLRVAWQSLQSLGGYSFLSLHCLLNGLPFSWQNSTFVYLQVEGFKKRRKRFPVVYSEGKIMAAEGGAPIHGK